MENNYTGNHRFGKMMFFMISASATHFESNSKEKRTKRKTKSLNSRIVNYVSTEISYPAGATSCKYNKFMNLKITSAQAHHGSHVRTNRLKCMENGKERDSWRCCWYLGTYLKVYKTSYLWTFVTFIKRMWGIEVKCASHKNFDFNFLI